MEKKEMVRVNTRISNKANDWLDSRSNETGLSKSALMMIAVENYIQQTEMTERMKDMSDLYNKIEELEKRM